VVHDERGSGESVCGCGARREWLSLLLLGADCSAFRQ
jgi:hypothetical protein